VKTLRFTFESMYILYVMYIWKAGLFSERKTGLLSYLLT